MLDDLIIFDAHFSHAVGAVLAHAYAVAPAAAGECVAGDGRAGMVFVHDKQLFGQAKSGADLAAGKRLDAVRPDDLKLYRTS